MRSIVVVIYPTSTAMDLVPAKATLESGFGVYHTTFIRRNPEVELVVI